MVDQETLQVGVAVRLAGAVVPVARVERSHLLQPLVDILYEAVLRIVDIDAGGDVHRGNQHHPFTDIAPVEDVAHPFRNIDVFALL